ncbi:MAG: hypothetical protein IJV00_06005 [Clostridia bacterium]|nr:hypothetical protein [Clostridia bacterium]
MGIIFSLLLVFAVSAIEPSGIAASSGAVSADRERLESISKSDPDKVDRIITERRLEEERRVAEQKRLEEEEARRKAEEEEARRKAEEERLAAEQQRLEEERLRLEEEERKAAEEKERKRLLEEQRREEEERRAAEGWEPTEYQKSVQERIDEIRSGKVNVWSLFSDAVIMGDSRAVGFWYYRFLPRSRILADGGHNIRKILDQLGDLKALAPKTVYLCYGLNDVGIGIWKTPEAYANEYMDIIKKLRAELPDTTFVISSILPATDHAIKTKGPSWAKIPSFNVAVQVACELNGVIFADNSAIVAEHLDLWDSDGVHLNAAFYPYWGRNLVVSVLKEELK